MLTSLVINPESIQPQPPQENKKSGLTYCLLHGSWHTADCFKLLEERLADQNHMVVAPNLEIETPGITYDEQIVKLKSQIKDPANTIFVGHSRAANLLPRIPAILGGARMLVYLCGGFDYINDRSFSHYLHSPPRKYTLEFKDWIPEDNQMDDLHREAAKKLFYNECHPEVRDWAAKLLRPMVRVENQPAIRRWPKVPGAFIYSSEDNVIRPEYSQYITRFGKLAQTLGSRVIEMEADHSPHLSNPAELENVLERLTAGVKAR